MEMEIKSAKDENLRNSVPYVKQLSTESNKAKTDTTTNGDAQPYGPTTQRLYLWTQVSLSALRYFILGKTLPPRYICYILSFSMLR